jgi:uncharacterized membrane protein
MEKENNKLAWISYLTILGWVAAIILYLNSDRTNTLVKYHLRQSLGIMLVFAAVGIICAIPVLGWLFGRFLLLATSILWLFGIIYALTGHEKPIPFIGRFIDEKLGFIK